MTTPRKDVPSTINGSPKTVNSRSGKSYNWVAKCGAVQRIKRDIHAHQKQCPICMSMIKTGPSAGKERKMHCGEIVKTHKKAKEHYQQCDKCQQIRREIRVQTCKKLEHTPEMRKKYSETAKKTAARADIQQQRAQRLKKWRDTHPEQFEQIRAKAHASPKLSKLEMGLEPHLTKIGFIRNTQLRCQTKKKQVDFVNRQKKMVIEIDGPWHFLPIRSEENLLQVQARDRMLNQEIMRRSWRLIRLSMQGFKGKSGELISPSLSELLRVIDDGSWEGIRCYGSLYEPLSWDGIKVTILK